jgi:hypothetical protein
MILKRASQLYRTIRAKMFLESVRRITFSRHSLEVR